MDCARQLTVAFPDLHDYKLLYIRTLAWDGRHDAAEKAWRALQDDDFEVRQLRSDLAWYRGDCRAAQVFQGKARLLATDQQAAMLPTRTCMEEKRQDVSGASALLRILH